MRKYQIQKSWGCIQKVLLGVMSVFWFSGCLTIDPPKHFLIVQEELDQIKALSSDEARFWVREFKDANQGDLAFWSEAIQEEFVKNRGYLSISEEKIQDGTGREGTLLTFESTLNGVPHRYLFAMFVIPGWSANTIRVAEYLAPVEIYEKYEVSIEQSIRSLR